MFHCLSSIILFFCLKSAPLLMVLYPWLYQLCNACVHAQSAPPFLTEAHRFAPSPCLGTSYRHRQREGQHGLGAPGPKTCVALQARIPRLWQVRVAAAASEVHLGIAPMAPPSGTEPGWSPCGAASLGSLTWSGSLVFAAYAGIAYLWMSLNGAWIQTRS